MADSTEMSDINPTVTNGDSSKATEAPPPYPGGPAYPAPSAQAGSSYPPAPSQPGSAYPSQPMYPTTGQQVAYVAPASSSSMFQPGVQGYSTQTQYATYPTSGQAVVVTTTQPTTAVVVTGAATCPFCKQGYMVEQFTFCGILLAILFFPIGLICCLMMKQRSCSNCRAVM